MRVLANPMVKTALPWSAPIEEVSQAFSKSSSGAYRTAHAIEMRGELDATFLMTLARVEGCSLAAKILMDEPGYFTGSNTSTNASLKIFDAITKRAKAGAESVESHCAADCYLSSRFCGAEAYEATSDQLSRYDPTSLGAQIRLHATTTVSRYGGRTVTRRGRAASFRHSNQHTQIHGRRVRKFGWRT